MPERRGLTILDAMMDPALFGRWFAGPTWDAWRVVLAALFGLSMTPWSGAYLTNDGQRITPADARAMADALERALPDIPDHDAARTGTPETFGDVLVPVREPRTLPEAFSGPFKDGIRTFIRFLRGAEAGVEIW